jgi:hypothetical protein
MNRLKTVILVLLFIISLNLGLGQNCYVVISELSGIDTSPFRSELENLSCEVIQSLPSEFKDQFKVYDFGFYLLNAYTESSLLEEWNNIVSEIESPCLYCIRKTK